MGTRSVYLCTNGKLTWEQSREKKCEKFNQHWNIYEGRSCRVVRGDFITFMCIYSFIPFWNLHLHLSILFPSCVTSDLFKIFQIKQSQKESSKIWVKVLTTHVHMKKSKICDEELQEDGSWISQAKTFWKPLGQQVNKYIYSQWKIATLVLLFQECVNTTVTFNQSKEIE